MGGVSTSPLPHANTIKEKNQIMIHLFFANTKKNEKSVNQQRN